MAHRAFARAGLLPSGRVGVHIFRYSLATRILRHGASVSDIAEVLQEPLRAHYRAARENEEYDNAQLSLDIVPGDNDFPF